MICFAVLWVSLLPGEDPNQKVSFKQPGKPLAAPGFRIQCNKWAILVRLLLGEIPERSVFIQKGMEKALRPYFELTNVSTHLHNFALAAVGMSLHDATRLSI